MIIIPVIGKKDKRHEGGAYDHQLQTGRWNARVHYREQVCHGPFRRRGIQRYRGIISYTYTYMLYVIMYVCFKLIVKWLFQDVCMYVCMLWPHLIGSGKVEMNNSLKEAVKKSSIHFGNEPLDYKSVVSTHTYIRTVHTYSTCIHTYIHTYTVHHAYTHSYIPYIPTYSTYLHTYIPVHISIT